MMIGPSMPLQRWKFSRSVSSAAVISRLFLADPECSEVLIYERNSREGFQRSSRVFIFTKAHQS